MYNFSEHFFLSEILLYFVRFFKFAFADLFKRENLQALLNYKLMNTTKIYSFCTFLILFNITCLKAQVTIGSNAAPQKDAVLDLQSNNLKGMLLPRLALSQTSSASPMSAHVKGMTVYNTATENDVTPGIYYNDGVKWNRLTPNAPTFFYSPSIQIITDTSNPAFGGIDLYYNYKMQFEGPMASSANAPQGIPVYNSDQLYYYVTWYDSSIFQDVQISEQGYLTYALAPGADTSKPTYMNVVFVVKP